MVKRYIQLVSALRQECDLSERLSYMGKKQEIEQLRARCAYLESQFTPEMGETNAVLARLNNAQQQETAVNARIASLQQELNNKAYELQQLNSIIQDKQRQIITFDDEILVQEFGLYQPRFDFANSDAYKDRLKDLRDRQKIRLKFLDASASTSTWQVNGSSTQGKKLVKDTQKLLYRAFNGECDDIIRRVKYENIDQSIKAITKSAEAVTKLGKVMGIYIDQDYYNMKVEETYLAFEFQQVKQREKEKLKELKEQEREARKLELEIEAARKKLEKERTQYATALKDLQGRLASAGEDQKSAIIEKIADLQANLSEIAKAEEDIDYREANQRAGYVYIISNIGSFGEGVYKIGMTRRLEPTERVYELGDASVPFNFDIHALVFADDAPGLEAQLHKAFDDRKLNLVNQRREFFRVSLEEIKQVIKDNYDQTVEYFDIPDAEQYRVSIKMREAMTA
jgi:chromosome segregation ATPase